MTSIGGYAFYGCSGLTTITIPDSVTSIGECAFWACNKLESVIALPETPPSLYVNSFSNYNIPLYAPATAIATYQTTSHWSKFASFVALSGDEPGTLQCAKPTITYKDGEITFGCETEGVTYHYALTTPSGSEADGNNIQVHTTYTVTVYAKKDGYLNSETATAEIDVRGLKGDVNQDGKVSITDAVSVVNIILNNGESEAPASEIEEQEAE